MLIKKKGEYLFYSCGKTNTSIHGNSKENQMNITNDIKTKIPITIFISRLYSNFSVFSSINVTVSPVINTTTSAHASSLPNPNSCPTNAGTKYHTMNIIQGTNKLDINLEKIKDCLFSTLFLMIK